MQEYLQDFAMTFNTTNHVLSSIFLWYKSKAAACLLLIQWDYWSAEYVMQEMKALVSFLNVFQKLIWKKKN